MIPAPADTTRDPDHDLFKVQAENAHGWKALAAAGFDTLTRREIRLIHAIHARVAILNLGGDFIRLDQPAPDLPKAVTAGILLPLTPEAPEVACIPWTDVAEVLAVVPHVAVQLPGWTRDHPRAAHVARTQARALRAASLAALTTAGTEADWRTMLERRAELVDAPAVGAALAEWMDTRHASQELDSLLEAVADDIHTAPELRTAAARFVRLDGAPRVAVALARLTDPVIGDILRDRLAERIATTSTTTTPAAPRRKGNTAHA